MVKIDYRKLIGFSKGSFVVTMPKAWVYKHNLKKGDTISIEEGSNELVFYAGEKEIKRGEKSISISAEDKKLSMIKAEIVSAYLNNYHTIEIFSETLEDDAPVIKDILRNLSGMEIIEQTGKRIVAKDLIDVSSIPIQSIIRRMDIITRSMIDDTILCMQGKCSPNSIIHKDTDVNRLAILARRVMRGVVENPSLSKHFGINLPELWISQRVIIQVERIADQAKKISSIKISSLKLESRKTLKNLYILINKQYGEAMAVYYSRNKPKSYILSSEKSKAIKYCDELLEKNSNHVFIHCIEHFKRILYSSRDILRCLMEIE